jgi:hypothetical protein
MIELSQEQQQDRISLASPLLSELKASEPSLEDASSPTGEASWDRLLDELSRLRRLEQDWDGQGALALDSANVDQAIAWVREMRRWRRALPPTHILPGTLGEVILEWRRGSFHLVAEIGTPTRLEWLLNLPGQPIKQWETNAQGPWIVRAEG